MNCPVCGKPAKRRKGNRGRNWTYCSVPCRNVVRRQRAKADQEARKEDAQHYARRRPLSGDDCPNLCGGKVEAVLGSGGRWTGLRQCSLCLWEERRQKCPGVLPDGKYCTTVFITAERAIHMCPRCREGRVDVPPNRNGGVVCYSTAGHTTQGGFH